MLSEKFTLLAFAGFIDAIRLAADEGDGSRQHDCSWSVLGDADQLLTSSCGVAVKADSPPQDPSRFDYVVVVGGILDAERVRAGPSDQFLRAAALAGVPLIGLCTGSFVLARAGLLSGYRVCVSWFHRRQFEERFPGMRVRSDTMFVVDRDRLTCAGGTSVVHLAAHLIERHCSRSQAMKSLRIMVEEQRLPSAAWQPEEVVSRQARDSLVRRAMLAIERDLSEPLDLDALAASLTIGVRQLERRFAADVGSTPSAYAGRLRMARARWMLAHTDRRITTIAYDCGFGDSAYFSRVFKNANGVSPSGYRVATRTDAAQAW